MLKTADPELMRAINRFHVIDVIRRDGPIARVEIAERTELSRATVSAITGDLLESGLIGIVTVAASEGGARGRPRVLLEMRGGACHVVGVKLATHRIGVTVTDARGEPLGAAAMPVRLARQPPGVIADLVEDGVRQCVADAGLRLSDIGGVGIGLPGVIDAAAGVSHWSPVLGARPVPFAAEIAARLGVPVLIESDADMVALAEHWFGPGRGPSTLMVVTIEDGIGMGLVLDGRIHRGARGIGPEFGHVKVEPLGLPCRCGGRGCLDAHASGWGILRQALGEAATETPGAAAGRDAGHGPRRAPAGDVAQHDPEREPGHHLGHGAGPDALAELARRADAGDERLAALFRRAGELLGLALANAVNTLNPSRLLVSGEGLCAGDLLRVPLMAALEAGVMPALRAATEIVFQPWGDDTGARGAAAIVLRRIYESPWEAPRDMPKDMAREAPREPARDAVAP